MCVCARDKASNILVDSWLANYKTAKGPAGTVSIPREEAPPTTVASSFSKSYDEFGFGIQTFESWGVDSHTGSIYLPAWGGGTTIVNACRPLAKPIQQKARVFPGKRGRKWNGKPI